MFEINSLIYTLQFLTATFLSASQILNFFKKYFLTAFTKRSAF